MSTVHPDAASLPRAMVALHHPPGARAERLCRMLEAWGWQPVVLRAPAQGLRSWLDTPFDLLLLNAFAGWEDPAGFIRLARSIAGSRPLLIVTDHDRLDERLLALRQGADDVVGWGEDPSEIGARIASLLRRSTLAHGTLRCAELSIDLIDRRVVRAGQTIVMPLREYDLLANLARTPDHVVSRTTLLRAVWRIDFDPGTNRVDVHVSRLRGRIDAPFAWPMLKTVKGKGYVLRSAPDLPPGVALGA